MKASPLCLLLALVLPASADLAHRWSFDETSGTLVADSVGGADGVIRGAGAVLTGSSIDLPGGSSSSAAYVDLPNGILSSHGAVTFEVWYTLTTPQNWAKVWDFGSTTGGELTGPGGGGAGLDSWFFAASRGTDIDLQRCGVENNDPLAAGGGTSSTGYMLLDTSVPSQLGRMYHVAAVWSGGAFTLYRDGVSLGAVLASVSLDPADMNDVNNWLGRSNWTGDENFAGRIHEFRIWDEALGAGEIAIHHALGPDILPAPTLVHRWSFSEPALGNATGAVVHDSVGGADGIVLGAGASLTGSAVALPGGSSASAAYVDLPNGLLSSHTTVTFEAWFTQTGIRSWARIWDFGSGDAGEIFGPGGGGGARDHWYYSACRSPAGVTDINVQRSALWNHDPIGGGTGTPDAYAELDMSEASSLGQQYHVVGVWRRTATGSELTLYRDGVNLGSVAAQMDASDVNDINNWLGRSNWTGDENFQGEITEFRIWDAAMDDAMVAQQHALGPDQPEPVPAITAIQILQGGESVLLTLGSLRPGRLYYLESGFTLLDFTPLPGSQFTPADSMDFVVVPVDLATMPRWFFRAVEGLAPPPPMR